MLDLTPYEVHPTVHLIQSPVLYRLEDLPRDFANEVCNWAIQDQDDDWDFNEEFRDCDFVVGTVNVQAIAAEISRVVNEMIEIRDDWRECYQDVWLNFDIQHKSYMELFIDPHIGDEAQYDRWYNSPNPVSLSAFHDDPNFPVLRDGWHRFHCAYANGVASLSALTPLYSLEPREYRKVWSFPWMD